MDYKFLMKVYKKNGEENIIYDNFSSLKNNIKNKDKNINATIRVTAESLLKVLNDKKGFINKDSKHFYNSIIKNYDFNRYIHKYETVMGNCYKWLKDIQEDGNRTVHGNYKMFNENDVNNKKQYEKEFN